MLHFDCKLCNIYLFMQLLHFCQLIRIRVIGNRDKREFIDFSIAEEKKNFAK